MTSVKFVMIFFTIRLVFDVVQPDQPFGVAEIACEAEAAAERGKPVQVLLELSALVGRAARD